MRTGEVVKVSLLVVTALLVHGAARPAGAQTPAPRFQCLTKAHGLPDNTVEAIVEDHRGFLWFGTPDGLARYDAHSVTVYRHDPRDPASLADNYVYALLEDSEHYLWVGTANGLDRYDPRTDSFLHFRHDEADPASLSSNGVAGLYEDRRGDLWAGTGNGLNRFDRATGGFERFLPAEYSPEFALCSEEVRTIREDRHGFLWFATNGCGVVRFDRSTRTFVHYRSRSDDSGSLSHDDVWDLLEDRGGELWLATMGGLDRYDRSRDAFERSSLSLGGDHLDSLTEDRSGKLWIGLDGGGLNVFDPVSGELANYRHSPGDETSLGSDVIRTVYEDRRGDFWAGTYTGGVCFYSPSTSHFSHYRHLADDPESLSHSAVLSFFEDGDGALWIGTEGGLNRLDRATGSFRAYRHDAADPASLGADAVLAVLRDSRGHLWAGTYHGGLNRLDPERGRFVRYQHDPQDPRSLSNPHVWEVFEDHTGELWLGTFEGLNRFDYERETFTRYLHDPSDDSTPGHDVIWKIYEDRGGVLWLATLDGLSRYDRAADAFSTYRHDEEDPATLSHNQVLSILEDREGILWIGTEGGGLNRFDRESETFRAFRAAEGLPNDKVYGLLEDGAGRLWISTNEGLSRFDPRAETFTNYSRSDGLLAYPFFRNASLKSRSGEMFFGGVNGFSGFFPDRVADNPHVPPVVFTDFQLFNQPAAIGGEGPLDRHVSGAERIRLRHDQSVITLSFAALNYRASEKNRYAYMLEGFDRGWSRPAEKRTATYTNLDPGRYVFRVKGSNNSGLWNEEGATVEIEVLPPFWATWWFRALALLAVAALLAGAYMARTRSIVARNRALEAEVTERRRLEADRGRLLAEMAEKNLALERQNAELERFVYTVSHDLRNPLITIKGFLGLVQRDAEAGEIEPMLRSLERIHLAAEKQDRLMNDLVDLSRVGRLSGAPQPVPLAELAREASELIAGRIADRVVEVRIEPDLPVAFGDRRRLLEVFEILLDNGVKYLDGQAAPRIEIGVRWDEDEEVVYVRDNGAGIDPRYHEKVFGLFERLDPGVEGTGVGLTLAKRIVESHGGRIWVESTGRGAGSRFCFTVPGVEEERRIA